ncbi:MAG: Gfo/Idh/MocA family protein [Bacteroidales bacterium]
MNISRRKFIRNTTSAAAGIGLVGGHPLAAASRRISPSDTVRVGLIGCRSMGFNILKLHLQQQGVECAALDDVDANILEKRAGDVNELQGKKPRLYSDYRKMLEDKNIDAVIIGTPDHWHCLNMVDACAAGKDVNIEKPLANSIGECDIMVKAANRYNKVVQVGMQQRSAKHWQEAIKNVQEGKLGKVRKVSIWANFQNY